MLRIPLFVKCQMHICTPDSGSRWADALRQVQRLFERDGTLRWQIKMQLAWQGMTGCGKELM